MSLAQVYCKQGHFGKAPPLQEEAIAIARRVWSDGSWFTGAFLAYYGSALFELDRYDDAEAALLEAHEILTATRGPDFDRTTTTAALLVKLYDAWGQPAQAAEWRAKLPVEQEAVASDEASPGDDKQDDPP